MKVALSLLLSEYVEATEVDYADTAGFQIVCPCCSEGVFRVSRTGRGGQPSRYFAHRHAGIHAECEMRVAGITAEARAAFNRSARGQTLDRFLSVLRQSISLDRATYGEVSIDGAHWRLRNGFVTGHLLTQVSRIADHVWDAATFESNVDLYAGILLSGMRRRLSTPFALGTQKRIAGEVHRHLLTEQARPNREFLLRHALLRVVRNGAFYARVSRETDIHRLDDGTPWGRDESARMQELLHLAESRDVSQGELDEMKAKVADLKARMAETNDGMLALMADFARAVETVTPHLSVRNAGQGRKAVAALSSDPTQPVAHLGIAVGFEYIGTLLRLPYSHMAANHMAGRPLLDGLVPSMDGDYGVARSEPSAN